jgi:hypothetical protein
MKAKDKKGQNKEGVPPMKRGQKVHKATRQESLLPAAADRATLATRVAPTMIMRTGNCELRKK